MTSSSTVRKVLWTSFKGSDRNSLAANAFWRQTCGVNSSQVKVPERICGTRATTSANDIRETSIVSCRVSKEEEQRTATPDEVVVARFAYSPISVQAVTGPTALSRYAEPTHRASEGLI